jgi:hypothetical protein
VIENFIRSKTDIAVSIALFDLQLFFVCCRHPVVMASLTFPDRQSKIILKLKIPVENRCVGI